MNLVSTKSARMELKTTDAAKDLLSMAAALDGTDVTSFVLGPAMEKARRVIGEHATISLTREGQAKLRRLLSSPPAAPTEAMRDLMNMPSLAKG